MTQIKKYKTQSITSNTQTPASVNAYDIQNELHSKFEPDYSMDAIREKENSEREIKSKLHDKGIFEYY